ncbi:MAG: AMP-binding protein, partial [Phycisphaerae bacterium]|nr:AMP-binding protein [Gemmatimonadaceae bacterium]
MTTSPLSYNQRALWFIHQENPASAAYHVSTSCRIFTPVNRDALRETVQALSDRHATLRTTYALDDDGRLLQHTTGAVDVPVAFVDAPGVSDEVLKSLAEADHRRPFDLERGPVFRATLISRSDNDHAFLITHHHIAGDAWSLAILLDEFRVLYTAAAGFRDEVLPRVEREYVEFVEWQEQLLASADGQRLAERWSKVLAAPRAQVELPGDRSPATRRAHRGATHAFSVSPELVTELRRSAREQSTTMYAILLAAYKALLYRLTGTQDIVVGTATAGRSQAGFSRTVGHFVNPVPLRTRLHADMSFQSLVQRVNGVLRAALSDQDYPLMLMVRRANVERDESGQSPLFSTYFGLLTFDRFGGASQDTDSRFSAEFAGLRCEPLPIRQQEGQFDLSLQLMEQDRGLQGLLLFNPELYDAHTIAALAEHYTVLLGGITMNSSTTLEQLPPHAAPDALNSSPQSASGHDMVHALLAELKARDIKLSIDGGKLKINAPIGALDAALKAQLTEHKAAVMDVLGSTSSRLQLRRVPRVAPLPISFAQQRLWFLDRMQPGNSHYNISFATRIRGTLDIEAFSAALNLLPQRHESLRLRIRELDGNPFAELMETVGNVVVFEDLSALDAGAQTRESERLVVQHSTAPFDLAAGPMIHCAIIRLSDQDHILVISMHHLASDGWSLNVVVREIREEYEARTLGRRSSLPALPLQYVDFAAWQREQLHSGMFAHQLAYWQGQLAGAPSVLELPADRPRPPVLSYRGTRRDYRMSPGLRNEIKLFARANDVTMYMVMLAAWQVLLHRYSGQDDIVVGSPMANRDRAELEGLVGCFVNNVVMRGNLEGNLRFRDFLSQMKSVVLGAFDNRELPFDRLVEGLRPERSTSHSPIFQVMFTLHSFPIDATEPVGLTLEPFKVDDGGLGSSRFDLTLEIDEHEGGLRLMYEYATDLFDAATITRMHEQYEQLLTAAIHDATVPVDNLPLLSVADERSLLATLNDTTLAHDRDRCVHQLVEQMAAQFPQSIAVQATDGTLTYEQLDARANRMAHLLRARGVADGALVGVCLERSVWLPVALLAVHKAGAAYVPVDPGHPAERLVYTLTDA